MSGSDIITAIATPMGQGGVGIIRISGDNLKRISMGILGCLPEPRIATFLPFLSADGSVIDEGISLYFLAPHSYTGENVIELQAHGGRVVLDMLLQRVLTLGARMALPGEFTERAFLNDKIDLTQAEAIADLIHADTEQAVQSAQKALQGVFSKQIEGLLEALIELRLYVESAIDFVEEEIDFLSDGRVEGKLIQLIKRIDAILKTAQQGCLLREGMSVVIAGKPNVGKSSLLNYLAGRDAAIVTDQAGTTRDVLREHIQIDGLPLHIIDTAGLRETNDCIEQEGVRRAREAIRTADRILWLIDAREKGKLVPTDEFAHQDKSKVIKIYNKIDLTAFSPSLQQSTDGAEIFLSVKKEEGMNLLCQHLKDSMGYNDRTEDVFIARRRHVNALNSALRALENAIIQLNDFKAAELVAEELHIAQRSLSEITGDFTSDDLLRRIFSTFCIGK